MTHILQLTDENFDRHFKESKLLVIEFFAAWCEPCKDFKRIFLEVASLKTEAVFASVDVEQEKKLAEDFTIKSIPTLAIIQNQILIFIQSGAMPKSALLKLVEQASAL